MAGLGAGALGGAACVAAKGGCHSAACFCSDPKVACYAAGSGLLCLPNPTKGFTELLCMLAH